MYPGDDVYRVGAVNNVVVAIVNNMIEYNYIHRKYPLLTENKVSLIKTIVPSYLMRAPV